MIRRRAEYRERMEHDLELLPLMNLFVVLIPMLLLSAVFLELSVIPMTLPSDESEAEPPRETLGLSIAIEDARWVVKGKRLEPRAIPRSQAEGVEELRGVLADLTDRFPENREVVILSTASTRYDDIVKVMDVSRETGLHNISLSGTAAN